MSTNVINFPGQEDSAINPAIEQMRHLASQVPQSLTITYDLTEGPGLALAEYARNAVADGEVQPDELNTILPNLRESALGGD